MAGSSSTTGSEEAARGLDSSFMSSETMVRATTGGEGGVGVEAAGVCDQRSDEQKMHC